MKTILFMCLLASTTVAISDEDFKVAEGFESVEEMRDVEMLVRSKYTPMQVAVTAFQNNLADGCKAFCNGVKVEDFDETVCTGLFYITCSFQEPEHEMGFTEACVGAYNSTQSNDTATVHCKGIMNTHYMGKVHDPIHVDIMGSYECSGHTEVSYLLPPSPPQLSFGHEHEKETYHNCHGSEVTRMSVSRHYHHHHHHQHSGEKVEEIVDRFFEEQYGLDTNTVDLDIHDHHHGHNGNFSYFAECDGEEVDFSEFQTCSDIFNATCHFHMGGHRGHSHLKCKGEYNGDWWGEACLGEYTLRMKSHEEGFHMSCHEDFGRMMLHHDEAFGFVEICHGFAHMGSGAEHHEAIQEAAFVFVE